MVSVWLTATSTAISLLALLVAVAAYQRGGSRVAIECVILDAQSSYARLGVTLTNKGLTAVQIIALGTHGHGPWQDLQGVEGVEGVQLPYTLAAQSAETWGIHLSSPRLRAGPKRSASLKRFERAFYITADLGNGRTLKTRPHPR